MEFGIREVADLVQRDGAEPVKAMFTSAGLKPAGWGLPTDWRGDESKWRAAFAAGAKRSAIWTS